MQSGSRHNNYTDKILNITYHSLSDFAFTESRFRPQKYTSVGLQCLPKFGFGSQITAQYLARITRTGSSFFQEIYSGDLGVDLIWTPFLMNTVNQANTRRWASVVDDGPTSAHHWTNASCFLRIRTWQKLTSRKNIPGPSMKSGALYGGISKFM